jgi:hypothetical protein
MKTINVVVPFGALQECVMVISAYFKSLHSVLWRGHLSYMFTADAASE